ncbi:MAG: ABC-type Fe3+-hydroxamate transport system substrate-binding protein [Flavobacteriales bacterium]|jgi:ABC-type Fe3+-hydroxamate transport system substrate-binding protein
MSILVKDQLGRNIELESPAKRIVSVVPSQTELLFDLGLDEEIIGVTKFCIHPQQKVCLKHNVGGTKNLRLEAIANLTPDLVIANKEENTEADINWLMDRFPVYVSDIENVNEALRMIEDIGVLVGQTDQAKTMSQSIASSFELIETNSRHKSVYLIWKNPYMAVGANNYINDLMSVCGFDNLLGMHDSRYPELSIADMQRLKPELVFLSSEPFPFKDEHAKALSKILPESKIILVDGEMFSWYGSRMKLAANYMQKLINSELN